MSRYQNKPRPKKLKENEKESILA